MNRIVKTTLAAIALSLTGASAFAQDNSAPITRQQVRAELAAARADGSMNPYLADIQSQHLGQQALTIVGQVRSGTERVAATQSGSGLTREQVRAELAAARRSGEFNPLEHQEGTTYRQAPRAMVAPAALAQVR